MTRKIEINKNLLSANQEAAARNREIFLKYNLRVVNIMSSPGSGKTALLEKTAAHFQDRVRLGILVGDLSTRRDVERIKLAGALSNRPHGCPDAGRPACVYLAGQCLSELFVGKN